MSESFQSLEKQGSKVSNHWKPYSEYGDYPCEWLERVPVHWQHRKLKFLARSYGGGTPSTSHEEYWHGSIPWVTPKDMKTFRVSDAQDCVTELGLRQSAARLIPQGAALLVVRSGILRHTIPIAIAEKPVALNQDMKAFVSRGELKEAYLAYLVAGLQKEFLTMWRKQGATVESLESDLILSTPIPLPPSDEQQKIADFLDRETRRIDALIAEKEKLLVLLEEKRTAMISHAVTKGLNPDAKMKDSGVRWLGEIPEHWRISRIKFEALRISKGTTPSTIGHGLAEDGIRFLKAENIQDSCVNPKPEFFIDEETDLALRRSRLMADDLLIVIAGATTGKSAVLSPVLCPANTNQAVCYVRCKSTVYAHILNAWLQGAAIQDMIWDAAVQAAQPNLAMEDVGNLICLVPADDELDPLVFADQ